MATKDEALKRAIKEAGSAEALAGKLGITPQAISQWKQIPLVRVLDIERATGISRHDLRPDFFGESAESAA
jgi:DNA-binding transcriptional regulator YdaS (Cro superfamily)